eukprot:3600423-Alexandrium_andersonii.AAC.1
MPVGDVLGAKRVKQTTGGDPYDANKRRFAPCGSDCATEVTHRRANSELKGSVLGEVSWIAGSQTR